MRYLIFFLLLSNTAFGQKVSKEFSLTVYPSLLDKGHYIYLRYKYSDNSDAEKVDSQKVLSDKVVFNGSICQPAPAIIYRGLAFPEKLIDDMYSDSQSMFLEMFPKGIVELSFEFFLMPGQTSITSNRSILESTIFGDSAAIDFETMKQIKRREDKKKLILLEKILKCQDLGDKTCVEQLNVESQLLNDKILRDIYLDYYNNHTNSPLALYALKKSIPRNPDSVIVYLERLSKLPVEIRKFPETIALKKFLEGYENSAPGKYVGDLQQLDTAGNLVMFKFSKKYVFLDFWESSSYLLYDPYTALYPIWSKYHSRNFTIVSIGLEIVTSREKWLSIIRKNNMPWIHFIDFKTSLKSAAQQFGVLVTPFNLLVDPEGKIIMRNVSPDYLDRFLSDVLK